MKDAFRFSSRSANKAPGKGSGERAADPSEYARLASHSNWRRVLSNFHVCDFQFEGRTYRTIEHGFQAEKFRHRAPHIADEFALESGSALSQGDGAEARKSRKAMVLNPAEIARWDARSQRVMEKLAEAKFAQCREARDVLLATGEAELWHVAPRIKAVRFSHLEGIRGAMRSHPPNCTSTAFPRTMADTTSTPPPSPAPGPTQLVHHALPPHHDRQYTLTSAT